MWHIPIQRTKSAKAAYIVRAHAVAHTNVFEKAFLSISVGNSKNGKRVRLNLECSS